MTPALRVDSHPRLSEQQLLVYPVYSRRSGGLSLGININPNKQCTFRCLYCQVERGGKTIEQPPALEQIKQELTQWLENLQKDQWQYQGHQLKDIAIAGDGEPSMVDILPALLLSLVEMKNQFDPPECKLVLYTNGTNLDRKDLNRIWPTYFKQGGEVWFKLDAWNEETLRLVNRTKFTFHQIIDNLETLGRQYPIVIQSCFFNWKNRAFNEKDYLGYVQLLQQIQAKGVKVDRILAYTLARPPEDSRASPWNNQEMDRINAYLSSHLSLDITTYYSKG